MLELCMQCKKTVENFGNRFNILESFSEVSTVSTKHPHIDSIVSLLSCSYPFQILQTFPRKTAASAGAFDFSERFSQTQLLCNTRARARKNSACSDHPQGSLPRVDA
jgi:hypothetical protein